MTIENELKRIADALESLAKPTIPAGAQPLGLKAEPVKTAEVLPPTPIEEPAKLKAPRAAPKTAKYSKEERAAYIKELVENNLPYKDKDGTALLAKKLEQAGIALPQVGGSAPVSIDPGLSTKDSLAIKPKPQTISFEAMREKSRELLKRMAMTKGKPEAMAVLEGIGVKKISDIPNEKLQEVIDAVNAEGVYL